MLVVLNERYVTGLSLGERAGVRDGEVAVSEDFAKGQPDLLIVDTIPGMPRCQGKVFDYLEYFQQNKVFADAFEHYEHLMDFDRYKIYRKKKRH